MIKALRINSLQQDLQSDSLRWKEKETNISATRWRRGSQFILSTATLETTLVFAFLELHLIQQNMEIAALLENNMLSNKMDKMENK